MLLARIKAYISRHNLLTRGETLAVGVSGGPDSITLLHLLTRLRDEYDLKLIAAYLDHGLRAESGRDAEFVARTAGAWGVATEIERVDVAVLAKTEHLSIEEAGRTARYNFFARVADTVAVAHNADDQAETVLMHFLRGSGMAGLRGMMPKSTWPMADGKLLTIIRPLLPVPRTDIEAYLAQHQLDFVTDATNADRTFFRNRLRHDLLPYLEGYNANIREVLRRTADVMAGDYELLRGLIEEAWDEVVILSAPEVREVSPGQTLAEPETLRLRGSSSRSAQGDMIKFKINRWRALPLALQRALLREAVHRLKPDERDADFTPIDAAARWAQTAESGHTADLLGGLCLSVVGDEL
ncbi:MAG TPA: tRNA lysidine(34) synthetase TilS, partial [Anaerolineales bacterium]|nr:tRNA lysidine(34) synthetase TilS [Anaerolineales bacterium]